MTAAPFVGVRRSAARYCSCNIATIAAFASAFGNRNIYGQRIGLRNGNTIDFRTFIGVGNRHAIFASGQITMQASTLARIADGSHNKGDVLSVARLAGIMAAKRCGDLIPLCHPIPLTAVRVDFAIEPDQQWVRCTAQAETVGRTGVEMEAMTAVSVALLTIYDMCKAVDRGMVICEIGLQEKRGGKSGKWTRD